jgi:hypothetical protein
MKKERNAGRGAGKGAKSPRNPTTVRPGSGKRLARPAPTTALALEKKVEAIKQLLAEADKQDVAARYKIAIQFHEVIAGDGKNKKYGAGAAKRLGNALGWSRSVVYAFDAVAKAWDQEKFDAMAAKRDKFGKPLSWSHLMVLAAEKDAKRRRDLTSQTLGSGWSVRELKRNVRGETPDGAEKTGESPKPPRPLTNAVDNYTTTLAAAKNNAGVYGETIGEQIENAEPAELKCDVLLRLKQARQDLEDHYRTEAARLDALIGAIEKGEHAPLESAADAAAETRRPKRTRK